MSFYLRSFYMAWFITVLVETLVLVGLFRKFLFKEQTGLKLLISSSVFANSLTLPYVWFVFPYLFVGHYSINLLLSELFAWLVEAVFYKTFLKISLRNALIASFIANVISYSLGYLLGHFGFRV